MTVAFATPRGLAEPWWTLVNKVSWITARRFVYARRRLDLEATESSLPPDWRQRIGYVGDEGGPEAALRRAERFVPEP